MMKVWARIGVAMELTEEEYKELQSREYGSGELMNRLVSEGRMYPEGDSYTPENMNGGVEITYSEDWTIGKQ